MGAAETRPCCSSAEPNAFVFDIVNPEGTCQEAWRETMSLPIAISACDEQEVETQETLTTQRFATAKKNSQLSQQLLIAIRNDDGSAVLQYVADGSDFEEMGEVLRLASHRGSASVVRELVAVGLTVNQACPQTGFTALHLAASTGHLLVTELLLDALADVHVRVGGVDGPTALSLVRQLGNPEVEEAIEQHIARQLVQEQGGANALPEEPNQTRLHVLPRVSQGLSEVMMRNIHATAGKHSTSTSPNSQGKIVALGDSSSSMEGGGRSPKHPQRQSASHSEEYIPREGSCSMGPPQQPESITAGSSPPRPPTPGGFSEGGTGGSGGGADSHRSGGASSPGRGSSGGEENGFGDANLGSREALQGNDNSRGPGFSLGGGSLAAPKAAGDQPSLKDGPGGGSVSGDTDAAIYTLSLGLGIKHGKDDQLHVQL